MECMTVATEQVAAAQAAAMVYAGKLPLYRLWAPHCPSASRYHLERIHKASTSHASPWAIC